MGSEMCIRDRLGVLLSILEERGRLSLYDKNVVVKTTGNLRLKEGACNLAALMSMASALKSKPIDRNTLFIGDVGLTGELKVIPGMDSRIKEAARMGFKTIYTPPMNQRKSIDGVEIKERRLLADVIKENL